MKKLMIAAAIVCAAVMSQAASIEWTFTETFNNSSPAYDLTKYSAYLFTESAWTDFKGLSADEKTFEAFENAKADIAAITSAAQGTTRTKYTTDTQEATGTSGNYYIVLANAADGYVASSALAATSYATPQDAHDAAAWTISVSGQKIGSGDFTKFAAVPEPTSGLLLLLGVAGLALKRRRA